MLYIFTILLLYLYIIGKYNFISKETCLNLLTNHKYRQQAEFGYKAEKRFPSLFRLG